MHSLRHCRGIDLVRIELERLFLFLLVCEESGCVCHCETGLFELLIDQPSRYLNVILALETSRGSCG